MVQQSIGQVLLASPQHLQQAEAPTSFGGTNLFPALAPLLQTGTVLRLRTTHLRFGPDTSLGQPTVFYSTRTLTRRLLSPGVEEAEQLNAQAMRRYRERWQKHLGAPRVLPTPVLYPSRIEEILWPQPPPSAPLERIKNPPIP
jgi:hypothetical protein